jgi:hypothetical protein
MIKGFVGSAANWSFGVSRIVYRPLQLELRKVQALNFTAKER